MIAKLAEIMKWTVEAHDCGGGVRAHLIKYCMSYPDDWKAEWAAVISLHGGDGYYDVRSFYPDEAAIARAHVGNIKLPMMPHPRGYRP